MQSILNTNAPHSFYRSLVSFALRHDLFVVLGIGLFLRLLLLEKQPLWSDELFSLYWSQMDLSYIFGEGARIETNPPLYYALLHFWINAFGTSVFALRLPSVFFSFLALWAGYNAGKILLPNSNAFFAGLLLAVNATLIYHTQQARYYSFFFFFEAMAIWGLSGFFQKLEKNAPDTLKYLALFGFAAALCPYAHYTGLFFTAACFGTIALYFYSTGRLKADVLWRQKSLFFICFLICLAAVYPACMAYSLKHSKNIGWIPPVSAQSISIILFDLVQSPIRHKFAFIKIVPTILLISLFSEAIMWARFSKIQLSLFAALPLIYGLILIIISPEKTLFLPYTGQWLILLLCYCLAHSIGSFPTPRKRFYARAIVIGISVFFTSCLYATQFNEDWRSIAQKIAERPECSGPVVFFQAYGLGLYYYQPDLATRPRYSVLTKDFSSDTAEFFLTNHVLKPQIMDVSELPAFLQNHPKTALVYRPLLHNDAQNGRPPQYKEPFSGSIMLACY